MHEGGAEPTRPDGGTPESAGTDPGTVDGATRRTFIRRVSVGAAVVASTGLAACGGGTSSAGTSSGSSTTSAGPPKRGGTLRAAFSGGSSTDTIDGDNVVNNVDFARTYQLYDSLVKYDENGQIVNSLAEEITPNKDATLWTIRLRPGITWHNGKDLTADDVMFTFNRITNPKAPLIGAPTLSALDTKNMKKLDTLTLQVPMHTPFSTFVETLPNYTYFIVPVGFDLKHPVGTGPFKFQSFQPGQQSTFVRNENYWNGPPYVDAIVITDYADEDESDQCADIRPGGSRRLPVRDVDRLGSEWRGQDLDSCWWKHGAHHDANRRGAVQRRARAAGDATPHRSAADARISSFWATGSSATTSSRTLIPSTTTASRNVSRTSNRRKSLLKQAGHEGLTTTFITAPMGQGAVQSAQVLAQQAKAAGVTINLREVTVTDFFGPNYLKWVFSQDTWEYFPYFPMVAFGRVAATHPQTRRTSTTPGTRPSSHRAWLRSTSPRGRRSRMRCR